MSEHGWLNLGILVTTNRKLGLPRSRSAKPQKGLLDIARDSYRTPEVWTHWRKGAGATHDTAGTVFKFREHGWF